MTTAHVKQRRAIVVGATSGIGREVAKLLVKNGYRVGITGRRTKLLDSLTHELGSEGSISRPMDLSNSVDAAESLRALIDEMGGLDLIVISAGVGFINKELEWEKEQQTIATNVSGFAAVTNVALRHFTQQSSGHLVAISSVAALRGGGDAPAYNASKAFMANYLEGLQQKVTKLKLPISITDVRPGFVDTTMAQGGQLFWVASPQKAAEQIVAAIAAQKSVVYVTRRWKLIAAILRLLPRWLYCRM